MKVEKKFFQCLLLIVSVLSILSGCTTKPIVGGSSTDEVAYEKKKVNEAMTVNLKIEDMLFQLELIASETTDELQNRLPLTLKMSDLNGNEKFTYLSKALPVHSEAVTRVEKGDVMLFGSDCLVLFYHSFETNYQYTKLGKIVEADQLKFMEQRSSVEIYVE